MSLLEVILGTGFFGLLAKELVSWLFNRRKKKAEAQSSEAAATASEIENEGSEIDNAFKAAKMWREHAEGFQKQFEELQSKYLTNLRMIQNLTEKIDDLTLLAEKQTREIVKLETKVQNLTKENKKLLVEIAK